MTDKQGLINNTWNHLDDACGSLYNAIENLHDYIVYHKENGEPLPEGVSSIVKMIDGLDVPSIVYIKNAVEQLMENGKY